MDTTALVCSTSTLPQAYTNDKQQSQDQENSYSDFDPFDSDYKSVDAQQVISNLPQIKDCEFNHVNILHHLEQLEINLTSCSKCPVASKCFASPEPIIQDSYKKSCHWKRVNGTSVTINIKPYPKLSKPYYYYMKNIRAQHPENRPKGGGSHRKDLSISRRR